MKSWKYALANLGLAVVLGIKGSTAYTMPHSQIQFGAYNGVAHAFSNGNGKLQSVMNALWEAMPE